MNTANHATPIRAYAPVPPPQAALQAVPSAWTSPFLREETFSNGSVIYSPQSPAGRLYLVRTGRARLLRTDKGPRPVLTDLLRAGGVFGRLPWEPMPTVGETAVASGTLVLWSADAANLGAASKSQPAFGERLTESLGKSLQQQRRRTWSVTFKESPARLAEALLQLGEDFGEPCDHGGHVDLRRISQEDIADLIGSCRSFVSTLINEMKRWGWLGSAGRVLCLRDLEALKKAAFEDE